MNKVTSIETTFFQQPYKLGELEVPNRVLLAPLAGVSDVPFRKICKEQGAGLTYVEMLSSVALSYRAKRTMEMLARDAEEDQLGVQLTGGTAQDVETGIGVLNEFNFDTIDINMGCPVRKIVKKGAGSAILQDPERVTETVERARAMSSSPLTAKIRTGYTQETRNVEDISERITKAGAAQLCIHGRTRADDYGVPVDYENIHKGFETARATSDTPPVLVGNGNVMDYASAKLMVESTGADAVMVSRGALGNPWIFKEILAGEPIYPTIEEWAELVFRHLDYHEAHYGSQKLAVVCFRKHLLWYVSGFFNTRKLRGQLSTEEDFGEVRRVLREYVASMPKDIRRFDNAHVVGGKRGGDYDPKYEMDRKHDRGVGDEGLE